SSHRGRRSGRARHRGAARGTAGGRPYSRRASCAHDPRRVGRDNRREFPPNECGVARPPPGMGRSGREGAADRPSHPCLVLYLTYLFVGVFAAQILVGALEDGLFSGVINPVATKAAAHIPFAIVRDFLVGEYGLITMGLTYAIAIVLPVVTTFFLMFGLLEDSGYIPRLAIFSDRLF